MVVIKFGLNFSGETLVDLPVKSRVLSVAAYRGALVMWVLAPNDFDVIETERCIFYSALTGQASPVNLLDWIFIGAALSYNGDFVTHVFRRK